MLLSGDPTKQFFFFSYLTSPFNVHVLPNFEPNKVVVDGPGIRNGIPASLETSFRIDTREAGFEQPDDCPQSRLRPAGPELVR